MSVGINIKKRRYELKMSQQELAAAMGYRTRSTIAKIESGENDVSQKKLIRFAEVLDTTVEALIGASTPMHRAVSVRTGENRVKHVAVILAGGKSGRNRQHLPSQFINIHGKPILVYSMDAYQEHPAVDEIYVVCLKGWENIVTAYAEQYGITKLCGLIPAGSSGMMSLRNAVEYLRPRMAPEDILLVQEATRPMVTVETLSRLLTACEEKGSATICHSMREYVQFDVTGNKARYVDRNRLIAMQSPEAHRMKLVCDLFDKALQSKHALEETCLTMLLYNLGGEINFVESSINNIKIVYEEDIAAFGALIK